MEASKKYQIPFSSLVLGKHEFEFVVDNEFFESFEYGEIRKGKVKVSVELDKKTNMALLKISFNGYALMECDRCLDEIELPVSGTFDLVGKEGEEGVDDMQEADNFFIIHRGETHLDLREQIHEFIHLALPMHRVCEETSKGSCNPEVLAKLRQISVNDKKENNKPTDPRWDVLKNVKLN